MVYPYRLRTTPAPSAVEEAEVPRMDNRKLLYAVIGVLVIAVSVLGYNLYQARKQPQGLQINVGPDGLKIQSK
jgi:hypothetical protein